MSKKEKPLIETKLIKHEFNEDEQRQLGRELAQELAKNRNVETEFDQVKAGFKSRLAECSARVDTLFDRHHQRVQDAA